MGKFIVDDQGKAAISNDGDTILKLLDVIYPATRSLVDTAKSQDVEAGDGTTSVTSWMQDDAEFAVGGRRLSSSGECQPASGHILQIPVSEPELPGHHQAQSKDVTAINYNEKIYELRVMETKPDKAVSITECDMNVDFDGPLGYKEPKRQVQQEESGENEADHSGYARELGFLPVLLRFWE
ncbi:Ubiquitin fusion degradation protein 1 like protein [Fukomys damarensis]|uniref:Ubiquitin fusion degradation protein 1 like protein n=1 Tax=Fukomys damarensis TaxID=885580 RepID=A0A091D6K0_FUKDA|nr:Ubiquitin fusion degradation protein 1 like protein [Fukomys damarensis]